MENPEVPHLFPSSSTLASLIDAAEDVPTLLNSLLSPDASPSTLDPAVASLLSRFSVLYQDTSAQLDRTIHDVSRTVPRLTYDLQFMRESAESVRTSLRAVHVQEHQEDVLARIVYLDKLKSRMEEAREVLREAESWSTLEQETMSLISSASYPKAAERLRQAENSLQVFTTTEYESRKQLLISLQNELEAHLTNVLRDVMSEPSPAHEAEQAEKQRQTDTQATSDPDPPPGRPSLKDLHGFFDLIQRSNEFRSVYFAKRRELITTAWAEATAPFNNFFEKFLAVITEEAKIMPTIFDGPLETLVSFIESTWESLSPSYSQQLESSLDDDDAVLTLINCKTTVDAFVASVRTTVGGITADTTPNAGGNRHSRRFSRSLAAPVLGWEALLQEPFLDYQTNYGQLERRYLSSRPLPDDLQPRISETIRLAKEAMERSSRFQGQGLASAIDHLVSTSISGTKQIEVIKEKGDEFDELADIVIPIEAGLAILRGCRNWSMEIDSLSTLLGSPLPQATQALSDLAAETQRDIQRTALNPIRDLLLGYPSLPIWNKVERSRMTVPTFFSPTDTISQVSESLLELLRVFEMYSGDPALSFSLETLPYVDAESLRDAPKVLPADLVVSTWVSSLALCLLAYLTISVLPSIRPPLSTSGASQLSTDLSYLSNALKALDVEWEDLETWREALEGKKGNSDIHRAVASLRS